jgi:hypothetical protein
VLGVRLLRTFGIWQPRRHVFFAEGRVLPGRSFAVVSVWIVVALGLVGAWPLRGRPGALAILLAPLVLAVVTTFVAFGYPRFRYAADISLIVMGAALVDAALAARRRQAAERPRRQLGWSRV